MLLNRTRKESEGLAGKPTEDNNNSHLKDKSKARWPNIIVYHCKL